MILYVILSRDNISYIDRRYAYILVLSGPKFQLFTRDLERRCCEEAVMNRASGFLERISTGVLCMTSKLTLLRYTPNG